MDGGIEQNPAYGTARTHHLQVKVGFTPPDTESLTPLFIPTASVNQADIQAIIREADKAMDGAVSDPGEFAGEIAVGPPEWMRRLSREDLRTLIKLLMLYIETFYACYCVSLALSEGNILDGIISDSEVQAVVHVLLTTLAWAYYLLEHGKNDD